MSDPDSRSHDAGDAASPPADARPPGSPDFEASLSRLEQIVQRMEQGDVGLEESLALFEEGIAASRACQERLSAAEGRVQVLLERDGELDAVDFTGEGR